MTIVTVVTILRTYLLASVAEAALTIATMPARIASGSRFHASMTANISGSFSTPSGLEVGKRSVMQVQVPILTLLASISSEDLKSSGGNPVGAFPGAGRPPG